MGHQVLPGACASAGSPWGHSLLRAPTCSSVGTSLGCSTVGHGGLQGTACLTMVCSTPLAPPLSKPCHTNPKRHMNVCLQKKQDFLQKFLLIWGTLHSADSELSLKLGASVWYPNATLRKLNWHISIQTLGMHLNSTWSFQVRAIAVAWKELFLKVELAYSVSAFYFAVYTTLKH